MSEKIPIDLRKALAASPGKPLRLEDEETQKVYVLIEEEKLPTLWDDYIRREVERGLAAVDRGEVVPLDEEFILAEARQRLQQQQSKLD